MYGCQDLSQKKYNKIEQPPTQNNQFCMSGCYKQYLIFKHLFLIGFAAHYKPNVLCHKIADFYNAIYATTLVVLYQE